MEIRINEQPLDFTIEREETLGEVVRELEAWLEGSDLVLSSVRQDDQELLAAPSAEWEGISHRDVRLLAVTVTRVRELRLDNLQTTAHYLALLEIALAGGRRRGLEELASGFPAMLESLRQLDAGAAEQAALAGMFGEFRPEEILGWPAARTREALELIRGLAELLGQRGREMADPRAAVSGLLAELARSRDEAQEISVLLQTGRDRQAMEAIARFAELVQSLLRVLHQPAGGAGKGLTVGGRSLEEFCQELNGCLGELVEAFAAGDSVLIGDLMEYEIAPRLEQMRTALEETV